MTDALAKVANNVLLTAFARLCMAVGGPLFIAYLVFSWNSESSIRNEERAARMAASAQITDVQRDIAIIKATVDEGIRQAIENMGRRIDVVERRQENMAEAVGDIRSTFTRLIPDLVDDGPAQR